MARTLRSHLSALVIVGTVASGLALACGGSSTDGSNFGNGGNGNGNGSGANGNGNGNGGSLGGGGSTGPGSIDGSCAATTSKGQQAPLDIYIMLDQSQSMTDPVGTGGDKWGAVTAALDAFVQSPQNGVSVGIQYFGLPQGSGGGSCVAGAPCQSDTDCNGGTCRQSSGTCRCGGGNGGGDSCTAGDYATPDVEIAPLPGVASKITASIAAHSPSTATPTSAALQGAVDHATTWAKAHTSDVTIVVLATDGDPTECDTSVPAIAQIAAKAAGGTPKILTFVIGVGSSTSNLNAIAQGGGTGNAFIVDTGGNAQQQFLDALNKIRGSALGCSYQIPLPTNGTPNYGAVNVQYVPGNGGATVTIPKVADKSQCPASGEAWYYDNDAAPTQILLCDATCSTILADKGGEVDVLLGCATVVK